MHAQKAQCSTERYCFLKKKKKECLIRSFAYLHLNITTTLPCIDADYCKLSLSSKGSRYPELKRVLMMSHTYLHMNGTAEVIKNK